MNLVIDYGNSSAKIGLFDDGRMISQHTFYDQQTLKEYLHASDADHMLISTVSHDAKRICDWATRVTSKFILSHTLPLPITNLYDTPQTLGVDRLAGACGAFKLFPAQASLVIDAGTCVTYDFVDEGGRYHGGAISPGLNMRFQAVHTFTSRLPLVAAIPEPALIGKTTEGSIQSGIVNGMIAEMEGIMARYRSNNPQLRVILCGGDTSFFENTLKGAIFAVPELVLSGLNSILTHNVKR
ncbi:MAG: type III pantothenate kinase [Bacteroidia bacterium]|nr:type III pantothenate kinase [Bacteroidia bacterium]